MEDIYITEQIRIDASELEVSFARSSGPGGQNVNKVNSKVSVHWRYLENPLLSEPVKHRLRALAGSRLNQDGTIQVTSQEHRDQGGNLRSCYDKLRELLLLALKPVKPRRPTKPSRSSQLRRLDEKRSISRKKDQRSGRSWD